MAVGGFFAISGYLITKSRFRTEFRKFAVRRALRIFPGYWACLIFTAFVAAGTAGFVRGGWSLLDAFNFLAMNVPMIKAGGSDIGATLAGLPYQEAWNGSLWTLRYEVLCYVVTGAVLTFAFVQRHRVLVPVAFCVVTVCSLFVHAHSVDGVIADVALLVPFFLAGATIYLYADKIQCNSWLAFLALVLLIATIVTGTGRSLSALPLAYLLLWLGIVIPGSAGKFVAVNDVSYGTYLYAFPVQQLLVIAGAHHLGVLPYILISIAGTAPLAVLSWFCVEKPANRLARPRRALVPIPA